MRLRFTSLDDGSVDINGRYDLLVIDYRSFLFNGSQDIDTQDVPVVCTPW
jgi:hypothetical protein